MRGDHPGFPAGLLVLATSDKGIPRILVPRHVQYDLVTQAHLDIHHQHYRKVHKLLRPIYYWPSMDDDIAAICKRCTICQLAKVRRQNYKQILIPYRLNLLINLDNITELISMVSKGAKS